LAKRHRAWTPGRLGRKSWVLGRCGRCHRKVKLEAGAAAAGWVAEPQLAVVGLGEPPGDVKP